MCIQKVHTAGDVLVPTVRGRYSTLKENLELLFWSAKVNKEKGSPNTGTYRFFNMDGPAR